MVMMKINLSISGTRTCHKLFVKGICLLLCNVLVLELILEIFGASIS